MKKLKSQVFCIRVDLFSNGDKPFVKSIDRITLVDNSKWVGADKFHENMEIKNRFKRL